MLAKAGEGDRVIKTKMVKRTFFFCLFFVFFSHTFALPSRNIYLLVNAKLEKHKEDEHVHTLYITPLCLCPVHVVIFFLYIIFRDIDDINFFSNLLTKSTTKKKTTQKKNISIIINQPII